MGIVFPDWVKLAPPDDPDKVPTFSAPADWVTGPEATTSKVPAKVTFPLKSILAALMLPPGILWPIRMVLALIAARLLAPTVSA